MAQIFNSYTSIRLYVTLNDSPLQNLLFQAAGEAEYFKIGFEFTLLEHDVVNDIMVYVLAYGEFNARLFVYGIDSVDPCGP